MAAETILDCAGSPLHTGIHLVEASAGTGKTYAIGMLVLRMIAELAIPIDKILVVTFTTAATEELRNRVRKRLAEARALVAGGVSPDATLTAWLATVTDRQLVGERLRQALGSIDRARIYTIHSFCQQMLTEQALESGQLFDVELQADVEKVRSQVVEDFWRVNLYQLSPRVCGIITSSYPTPAALYGSVAAPGLVHARLEPAAVTFAEAAKEFESRFAQLAEWWHRSSAALCLYIRQARDAGQLKKPLSEDLDLWWSALGAWLSGGSEPLPANLAFLTRAGLKETLNGTKVRKNRQDEFLADWPLPEQLAAGLLQAVAGLLVSLRRELAVCIGIELEQRLRESGRMSFDELIARLDRALAVRGEGLRQRLAKRFTAALIDEFQDTDGAQWRIFSRLFGGGEHYLYLIGDPKQAIYHFRGADIFSYFAARDTAEHHATLPYNYRSHPLLVQEVNRIFAARTKPFLFPGDVLPFYPVAPAKSADDGELCCDGSPLEAMVYCQLASNPKERTGLWSSGKAAERFREYVIGEVCRLLDREKPVVCRKAREADSQDQPLVARDIAVLVRSHRQADEYLQAFAQAGVPAVVSSKQSVFSTEECRELLILVQALAAPTDLFTLKNAMTLSWFGLSGNELLKIWQDDQVFDDWFSRFLLYHKYWLEKGFLAMMNRLLREEDVHLNLARRELAERRIANIHHLLELVQEVETAEKLGPDRLVVWLKGAYGGKAGEEETELRLESDEQAVRIVTMHSAKGLQYPVVFCPLLWYRSDRLNSSDIALISCHEDDGLVIDLGSDEIDKRRQRAAEEELAEDLRLTYVALTRAQLRCYVMWADVKRVAGKIASSRDSALGYLLFPEEEMDLDLETQKCRRFSANPGVLHVQLPAEVDSTASYNPRPADGYELAPLQPGERSLHTDYQMSSYSAMASLSEQEDHGAEAPAGAIEDTGPAILHPGLPAGASFGNLIHDALETLPFSSLAAGAAHQEELARLARRYGLAIEVRDLQALLATIVSSRLLPGERGFSLSELHQDSCLSEMPFYFQVSRLETRRINEILAGEPTVAPLSPRVMQGYLTGFVDLVCEHNGRFYILDYKTNYLGTTLGDYRPDKLTLAMASHNYGLQYWIYTLVLHRYLSQVVDGYQYERHFGGVFYLFVRGMSPALPGSGVYSALPSLSLLQRLDQAVGGGR